MTGIRGVLAGVLALVALEALVSTQGAADRTAGALGGLATFAQRVLDPAVAAIPRKRGGAVVGAIYEGPTGPVVIAPGGNLPDAVAKYKPTKPAS